MALDLSGVAEAVASWCDDIVLVERPGAPELDEDSGDLVDVEPDVVYDGQGMVQPVTLGAAQTDPVVAAQIAKTGARFQLVLPVEETPEHIKLGDVVRVRVQGSDDDTEDVQLDAARYAVVADEVVSSFAIFRIVMLKVAQ